MNKEEILKSKEYVLKCLEDLKRRRKESTIREKQYAMGYARIKKAYSLWEDFQEKVNKKGMSLVFLIIITCVLFAPLLHFYVLALGAVGAVLFQSLLNYALEGDYEYYSAGMKLLDISDEITEEELSKMLEDVNMSLDILAQMTSNLNTEIEDLENLLNKLENALNSDTDLSGDIDFSLTTRQEDTKSPVEVQESRKRKIGGK